MSWSDLAFLSSVRSALEVAVVGFVVHHFPFCQTTKNDLLTKTFILQRQRHPVLPIFHLPGYSAASSFRPQLECTFARRRPSSVVVVGVGGGGGCRRLLSCRPSHTGRRYRTSSSEADLVREPGVERGGVIYACP